MLHIVLAAALAAVPMSTTGRSPSAPTSLPDRYMALKDVKVGMKGVGKTVLRGVEIVEFGVEVLGVLRNVGPKQDMILVQCSGQGLEQTGIIAGMSGSPVYIDGKLVGAVAYGWRFTKSAMAGLTPIEEMLAVGRDGAGARAAAVRNGGPDGTSPVFGTSSRPSAGRGPALPMPSASVHTLLPPLRVDGHLYDRLRLLSQPPSRPLPEPDLPTLSPIVTPVMVSGASGETLARLGPILERAGCVPVQAGGLQPKAEPALKAALEPGAVCAVSLATGDLDLTAIGTVTDRVGDVIWAFGHPFYGEGEVEMPLSTGAVLAVVPSQMFSVKFGVPLERVGAVTADEVAGVRGLVGRPARTVPLEVQMHLKPRPAEQYRFELMRHPRYTPGLIREVMYQSIFARVGLPPECTVRLEATLDFAGRPPVRLGNVYAGSNGAFQAISRVYWVADGLLNNDIEPVALEKGALAVTVDEGLQAADIESLRLEAPKVKPGEEVVVHAVMRPYRAEREVARLRLLLPPETPEGIYTLVICDASTAGRLDLAARPHRVEPRTLDDLFSLAQEDLDNRHLHARLQLTEAGVAVEGRELPRLPAFALDVFGASRWSGVVTPIRRVLATDVATPWVVLGRLEEKVQVTKNP